MNKYKKILKKVGDGERENMATREHRERSHDSAKAVIRRLLRSPGSRVASLDCVLCTNRKALGQNGSSRRMMATRHPYIWIPDVDRLGIKLAVIGVVAIVGLFGFCRGAEATL